MAEFRGWVLPDRPAAPAGQTSPLADQVGSSPTHGSISLAPAEGRILVPELNRPTASRILSGLQEARDPLRKMGTDELIQVLGVAGRRLLDPKDSLRREAEEWLPRDAGLSAPMARYLLDRMARDWTTAALTRLVEAEFPDVRVLEGFVRRGDGSAGEAGGEQVRVEGDRLSFHVGAGNVAGVGATSMLRSLLVRSPVLLKPGRGDVVLPVLVARALAEADPRVGAALAVAYWPGGSNPPLEALALERARRVVIYGGMDTVSALRRRLPASTPLVAYHHRISAGAVGRGRLESREEARTLARHAAEAVSAYDQRGCVSPHVIWVEEGGGVTPSRWAELLAEAMEEVGTDLPPGPVPEDVAARIQQLRGTAEMQAAAGTGHAVLAPEHAGWTVLYEPDFRFEAGCTGRLVRVQGVQRLEAVPTLLEGHGELLQSMALEVKSGRRQELAGALSARGVSRITTFRRQPWPPPWWLHDGKGPLRALVRWSTLERSTSEG